MAKKLTKKQRLRRDPCNQNTAKLIGYIKKLKNQGKKPEGKLSALRTKKIVFSRRGK